MHVLVNAFVCHKTMALFSKVEEENTDKETKDLEKRYLAAVIANTSHF